jgi:hypothetical protein
MIRIDAARESYPNEEVSGAHIASPPSRRLYELMLGHMRGMTGRECSLIKGPYRQVDLPGDRRGTTPLLARCTGCPGTQRWRDLHPWPRPRIPRTNSCHLRPAVKCVCV